MKPSDKEKTKYRLQVFLSHSGFCSRRQAMDIIFEGRVKVNGRVNREPSTQVDPSKDNVSVDHREISLKLHTYIMLNKPADYITTVCDEHASKTVLDLLPLEFKHLYPVGRLDKDTEGLLLLTNDGDFAYQLTHPKFNIDKTYAVLVKGLLTEAEQKLLEEGIVLDGVKTSPAKISNVRLLNNTTELHITIHEGRKRHIRRILYFAGHRVLTLKRIQQGDLALGDLALGQWRHLTAEEIAALKALGTKS